MQFFLIVMSILGTMYGYIGWRMILPSGLPWLWKAALWTVLIIFLLLPPGYFFLRFKGRTQRWIHGLARVMYMTLGYFIFTFTLLVIRDSGLLVAEGVQKGLHLLQPRQSRIFAAPKPHISNHFINLTNLGILGFSGFLLGLGYFEARRQPRLVHVKIPIAGLPPALHGFRMAQISDLHVSISIRRPFVEKVVQRVNALCADAIVFTGDLADGSVAELRSEVEPLANLTAPMGVYFVTGNHEYYSGANAWINEARRLGLRVLLNEHVVLRRGAHRILLAGVTDYNAGSILKNHISEPETAVRGAPACDLKILLAHQPRSIFAAARLGFHVQISGHTHGGQFFPGNLMVRIQQPYVAGLYRHKNTWLYVSRGTGFWGPPLRLGAPSEITLIEFVPEKA